MVYFISGHRDLTQEDFDKYYKPIIEDALYDNNGERIDFVIGDYGGVDTMAQDYLEQFMKKNLSSEMGVPYV